MVNILQMFGGVFQGAGHLAGKLNVDPLRTPQRRVPIALAELLKQELTSLQAKGMVAAVN